MDDASPSFADAWARLAGAQNPQIRTIASRLMNEPAVHRYFPYAAHSDLRISRSNSFPWDNEGLPLIAPGDQEDHYLAAFLIDGFPAVEGDLETVVPAFLEMLAQVETR